MVAVHSGPDGSDRRCLGAAAPQTRRTSVPGMRHRITPCAVAFGTAVLFLTSLGIGGPPIGASPPSPAQLLSQSVNAAHGSSAMEFVDTTTTGSVHQKLVGNVSPATAVEQVTGAGAPVTVELIGGVVYVQAGTDVLQNSLSLPAAGAKAGNGKWIAVHPDDAAFSLLTQRLTIDNELDSYIPASHIKYGRARTIGGHRVMTITGTVSPSVANGAVGSAFLVVRQKSPHLPVEGGIAIRKNGTVLNEAAAFTAWGSKVSLQPPTGAIPYASLLG